MGGGSPLFGRDHITVLFPVVKKKNLAVAGRPNWGVSAVHIPVLVSLATLEDRRNISGESQIKRNRVLVHFL